MKARSAGDQCLRPVKEIAHANDNHHLPVRGMARRRILHWTRLDGWPVDLQLRDAVSPVRVKEVNVKLLICVALVLASVVPALAQDRVLVGMVRDVSSRFAVSDFGDQRIVSDVVLDVEETIRGPRIPIAAITVEGGTVGDLTMTVSDLPLLRKGDRAVVYMESGRVRLVQLGALHFTTYAYWAAETATFFWNPDNADVPPADAAAAFQYAANVWNAAGSDFRFVAGGPVADTVTGFDNRNVVIFRPAASPENAGGSIASTYSWWGPGNQLLDSDVIFWDGPFTFYTGTTECGQAGIPNSAYIEDVATHEFGHMLGLGHSDVLEATMFPSYYYCSQEGRTLAADDIAGVIGIYGSGDPEPPPPPPPPPPPVPDVPLLAATVKAAGWHQVVLAWFFLPSTDVDIYRDGVLVVTTPNDGDHTEHLRLRGSAVYVYQVCAAGTATCTNTVTVIF